MPAILADYYDPYDLWATVLGVRIRHRFYAGRPLAKGMAMGVALCDWLVPMAARWAVAARPRIHPITVALHVLTQGGQGGRMTDPQRWLAQLQALAAVSGPEWSWGLGFPWMSKNGLYGPEVPFVTHTPYVMEALLALSRYPAVRDEAFSMFHGTWAFLERLEVMHAGDGTLALSYAPVDEPRIVVNANAYAGFAYALHGVHGGAAVRKAAREKAAELCRWVVGTQGMDGCWRYYADDAPGNFIDGFHSCFVIKNLNKVAVLLPELRSEVAGSIERGWRFIEERFYDARSGLCRRFVERDIADPFRWDLYDQAEYLGLLIDFERLDAAAELRARVARRFSRGQDWWCRRDFLGRRWGKNFLRWGIAPFWYHSARLDSALQAKSVDPCAG